MAAVTIPTYWFQGLIILVIVLTFLLIALLMAIKSKMPEAPTLLKASLLHRPVVQLHTHLMETRLFAPPVEGKKHDGNMYDIASMGVKLIPNPAAIEHLGTRRHIQYFSKASVAVSARVAAACRDFNSVLKNHGIEPTESIVDSLLVADDQELLARYPPVPVMADETRPDDAMFEEDGVTWRMSDGYNTILQLRDELKEMVIRDGQFVFQTVQDFIFAVQAQTSRGQDEYCSIANERAVAAAGLVEKKDYTMTIFLFVFLLIGGAIAYKIVTG
jgi:hypothetical protein